jgi:hypothetical protein
MSDIELDKNFDICIHIKEHTTRKHKRKKLILIKMAIYGAFGILFYLTFHVLGYLSYLITLNPIAPLFSWRNLAGMITICAFGFIALNDIEIKARYTIYKLMIYGIYGILLILIYTAISDLTFTWGFLIMGIVLSTIGFPIFKLILNNI